MLKMVRAMVPAMMAATVGTDRVRCRAASRVAIRAATGNREASMPASTRTIGTNMSAPTVSAMAHPATAISRWWVATEATRPTPPPTASTAPMTGRMRLTRGETLCPFITPMMSRRRSRVAGISAATSALMTAITMTAATAHHGASK